jgi:hypothetical protein
MIRPAELSDLLTMIRASTAAMAEAIALLHNPVEDNPMSSEVVELRPTKSAHDLLDVEDDLLAVKRLAFAVNLITSSDRGMYIETGVADALWQLARQIEDHADALIERWEAALKKQGAPVI